MHRGRKISLYLPCRNEAAHLPTIIGKIPSYIDEVIIVSNRSTDSTPEVATLLGVKALVDDRTKGGIGYGYAHMTGLAAATGDIIVTADGDGTYPIENTATIIDALIDQNMDFISCNRYPVQAGTKIPLMLQLGVTLLNWEVRLLYFVPIQDILSGMWFMTKETRDKLRLTEGDWNLSPQIKILAATNPEIRFREYHIPQHLRMGETKQAYFKTGMSHAWWIFKNRFTKKHEA